MRPLQKTLLAGLLAAAVVAPVVGQVHKYFTPGSVWSVTMIRIAPGMDQMVLAVSGRPVQEDRGRTGQGRTEKS